MKFAAASLLLAAASCVSAAEEPTLGLRGLQSNGNAYGKMKKACTILLAADLRIPGSENSGVRRGLQSGSDLNAPEESIDCELDPEDANGEYGQIMKLNLDPAQEQYMREAIADGSLISATSTYFDPEADIDLTSFSVTAPPGKAVGWTKNGKASRQRRKLAGTQSDGPQNYLVVKVFDENGLARSESPATISDDVFGTGTDTVNLKSQAEACSYGKLTINAASDTLIGDTQPVPAPGVIEIQVNLDLTTNDRYAMHNAVTSALNARLGTTLSAGTIGGAGKFNNVLYVMQGCYVGCGYAAYAYINSWLSVYQGVYYKYVGVQMHELGHNWGMAHSGGLDGATYTDHTGLMGNPLYSDDVGKMCFNPAKNWYLGWYSDKATVVDPQVTTNYSQRLHGIANYEDAAAEVVVLKIETGTANDYFVGFNRAVGINSQNDEADNEVVIVKTGQNGEAYSQSFLQAHLVQGETFTIDNFQGTGSPLRITANFIDLTPTGGEATISIELGEQCSTENDQCSDGLYCNGVETCVNGLCQAGESPCSAGYACNELGQSCEALCGTVSVDVTTDNYPTEISWQITDSNSAVVMSGSGYSSANTVQPTSESTLTPGSYTFSISDSYGDGICCSYGQGSYSLKQCGVEIKAGGDYGSGESHSFDIVSAGPPPTAAPVFPPTPAPVVPPTPAPTPAPTNAPTGSPTTAPVTPAPTDSPTTSPTKAPTSSPTQSPTGTPTTSPTKAPSSSPSTSAPTTSPTQSPTGAPTTSPTKAPTSSPTQSPTKAPSSSPSTSAPTSSPTQSPTGSPTTSPTKAPTSSPTSSPTGSPTTSPTKAPSSSPSTSAPTSSPTQSPTGTPTENPTNNPTSTPTPAPTGTPTPAPTGAPTAACLGDGVTGGCPNGDATQCCSGVCSGGKPANRACLGGGGDGPSPTTAPVAGPPTTTAPVAGPPPSSCGNRGEVCCAGGQCNEGSCKGNNVCK